MGSEEEPGERRGPQGGVPRQPGRGHDRKSAPEKKKRFARKAARERRAEEEDARKAWEEWDGLPEDVRRLLGPTQEPRMPRPSDD